MCEKGAHLICHLYAIVTHYRPISMEGHFIAFCKSPFDNKLYQYNESIVTLIGHTFKQVNEIGCQIYFYIRDKNNNITNNIMDIINYVKFNN